jgi:hypothetical protein
VIELRDLEPGRRFRYAGLDFVKAGWIRPYTRINGQTYYMHGTSDGSWLAGWATLYLDVPDEWPTEQEGYDYGDDY